MKVPPDVNGAIVPKIVWLTFDDGPHPEVTPRILDVLDAFDVKATFFVLGSRIKRLERQLLARIDAGGHSVGNHGFSHRPLQSLSPPEIRDEITRTAELISELRNTEMIFRPPYGATNPIVDEIVEELGYRTILWHVDSLDWHPTQQPDGWVDRTVALIGSRLRSIVLAHDIQKTTADHLGSLIERIGDVRFARLTLHGERKLV